MRPALINIAALALAMLFLPHPAIARDLPDLVIASNLIADPGPLGKGGSLEKLARGEKVFISGVISNAGRSNARLVTLVLYVNGIATDTQHFPSVIAGMDIPFFFGWAPPRSGNYIVRVTADPERMIEEVTAANNSTARRVDVRYAGAAGTVDAGAGSAGAADVGAAGAVDADTVPGEPELLPDLFFRELPSIYPLARLRIPSSIAATIVNGGDVPSLPVTVRMQVAGEAIESDRLASLRPGEWTTMVFRWTPRSGGRKKIIVTVDPDGEIQERFTENNRAVLSVRVRSR